MTAFDTTPAMGKESVAQRENHTITARMVRTPSGVETEYTVDGAVVGSAAEVAALLEGSA